MTRFLIALCGFAGGIVSALILASIFTAGNGELVEPKTTVAQSQEGVTAVNRQAKQSPDNSEERRQSAASEAPEVPDSEPFAPVLKSLSPGSPLRDFALRFRKAGLWDKMPICDLSWRKIGGGYFQTHFDVTQVGAGKIIIELITEYNAGDDNIYLTMIQFRPGTLLDDPQAAVSHLAKVVLLVSDQMELMPEERRRLLGFWSWLPVVRTGSHSVAQIEQTCLQNTPPAMRAQFQHGMTYLDDLVLRTKLNVTMTSVRPAIGAALSSAHVAEIAFCPAYAGSIHKVERADLQSGWFTFILYNSNLSEECTGNETPTRGENGGLDFTWPRLTVEELDAALAENQEKKPE